MYLRFQTKIPNDRSGTPIGFLVAAHELRDEGSLDRDNEDWLEDLIAYFNTQLEIPACLNDDENRRGVSWFKAESSMIDQVWSLVTLLEEQGIFMDILRSEDPGTLIYEDEHQVVAKPKAKNRSTPSK